MTFIYLSNKMGKEKQHMLGKAGKYSMKIIVLAGGTSTEREVSIVTGDMVCQALRQKGHDAALLDVYFGTKQPQKIFTRDYQPKEALEEIKGYSSVVEEVKRERREFFGEGVMELCQKADVVFMALHGQNGEDGRVQAAFDLYGVRYTGAGCLESAMAMDKSLSKTLFERHKIPVPAGFSMKKGEGIEKFREFGMTYPCVVKPTCGGSSIGVVIVEQEEAVEAALEEAFSYEDHVVVEQFIKGHELSVGVVAGEAYPIIEIVPKTGFYDYKNKYEPGATEEFCPARISKEATERMQRYAEQAAAALLIDTYCRVDFLMDEEEHIYCLEVNTLPGMTPTSLLPQEAAVLGMDFGTLCETLIEVSNERN